MHPLDKHIFITHPPSSSLPLSPSLVGISNDATTMLETTTTQNQNHNHDDNDADNDVDVDNDVDELNHSHLNESSLHVSTMVFKVAAAADTTDLPLSYPNPALLILT